MFGKASEKDGKTVIHATIKIMGILTCHLVIKESGTKPILFLTSTPENSVPAMGTTLSYLRYLKAWPCTNLTEVRELSTMSRREHCFLPFQTLLRLVADELLITVCVLHGLFSNWNILIHLNLRY